MLATDPRCMYASEYEYDESIHDKSFIFLCAYEYECTRLNSDLVPKWDYPPQYFSLTCHSTTVVVVAVASVGSGDGRLDPRRVWGTLLSGQIHHWGTCEATPHLCGRALNLNFHQYCFRDPDLCDGGEGVDGWTPTDARVGHVPPVAKRVWGLA